MPKRKKYKVIIDTNIWISYLIGKKLHDLTDLIIDKEIDLITSDQIFKEIELVTKRPKLRKYFPKERVQELIEFLKIIGKNVTIKSDINICQDPKDNFLLSLSKDSSADFLITGDNDLLRVKKIGKTEIVNYNRFESKIR